MLFNVKINRKYKMPYLALNIDEFDPKYFESKEIKDIDATETYYFKYATNPDYIELGHQDKVYFKVRGIIKTGNEVVDVYSVLATKQYDLLDISQAVRIYTNLKLPAETVFNRSVSETMSIGFDETINAWVFYYNHIETLL